MFVTVKGNHFVLLSLTTEPQERNALGDGAKAPVHRSSTLPGRFQANMLWSSEPIMISYWSRLKAVVPSPYNIGMWISKIPKRQYAMSSERVVCRIAAHDIRWAIE